MIKKKMMAIAICLWMGACFSLFGAIDAKFIGKNYYQGVAKIILYDEGLVNHFKLDEALGELSRGSGFFVLPEGILFTNRHVIEWCVFGYMIADWTDENDVDHKLDLLTYTKDLEKDPKIKKIYYMGHATPVIQVFNGEDQGNFDVYIAKVLTLGETFDGAMLGIVSDLDGKPVKKQFVSLPLGNSNQLTLGEDLVILGFPAQYSESDLDLDLRDTLTMSFGKHSGWDYVFDEDNGFIKTVAAIHEGNSGGPVFGEENNVIGIATALGVQTQIGLVGAINNMYYVVQPEKKIFNKLVELGLIPPKKSPKHEVLTGEPRELPKVKLQDLPKEYTKEEKKDVKKKR